MKTKTCQERTSNLANGLEARADQSPTKKPAMTRAYKQVRTYLDIKYGGAEGDRTLDLRIANAALSQLSYCPMT